MGREGRSQTEENRDSKGCRGVDIDYKIGEDYIQYTEFEVLGELVIKGL